MRKKWEKVSLGLISLGRNNNRTVRRRKPTRLYRYEFIAFHFSSPRTFYPPRIIRAAYPNMRKAIKQARAFFPSSVANNGKTRTIRQTNIYIFLLRNKFVIGFKYTDFAIFWRMDLPFCICISFLDLRYVLSLALRYFFFPRWKIVIRWYKISSLAMLSSKQQVH